MGYSGKLELKIKAQNLRRNGWSVKAIEKELKVSRSSVSIWIRDIKLTDRQLKKLYLNKRTGGLKGSIIASINKIKRREELTKKLNEEGKREIGKMSKRDRFIAGIALYFAEGSKRDSSVSFTNSNFEAIKFMTSWLKEFCKVPNEKISCNIYLHDNLNENKAKFFWSSSLGIPLSQFKKNYIVKNNPKRLRKTINPFGVFRITVHDINLHRKIMGWISGLFGV